MPSAPSYSAVRSTMESKKIEAERVKALAEKKFRAGDVKTALRMAVNAKALFPSLPFLPHVIASYRVHVAAGSLPSSADDWRAVLGIGPSADRGTIKKQFKRMRLLTHPDKNPSAAADGAFKLVVEAWSVLSGLPDTPAAAPPPPANQTRRPPPPNGKAMPTECPLCGTPFSERLPTDQLFCRRCWLCFSNDGRIVS